MKVDQIVLIAIVCLSLLAGMASAAGGALDFMSEAGRNSARVLYAPYVVRQAYTGPVFRIYRKPDEATVDVYASTTPNGPLSLGPGYTGTTLESWLGLSPAYVKIWYDQSGNNMHATQYDANFMPGLDLTTQTLDFTMKYFDIPGETFQEGDKPYSYIVKHGPLKRNACLGALFKLGWTVTNQQLGVVINTNFSNPLDYTYTEVWWNNDISFKGYSGTPTTTIAGTYDLTTRKIYSNGVLKASKTLTLFDSRHNYHALDHPGYIGRTWTSVACEFLNAKVYHFFSFSSALSTSDLQYLETTVAPTVAPTSKPTDSAAPSSVPTTQYPTALLSNIPTSQPSWGYLPPGCYVVCSPTAKPSSAPTTKTPTVYPTNKPSSYSPTFKPTAVPTSDPTQNPTSNPTAKPTTATPTLKPTLNPTSVPTQIPTSVPTAKPTSYSPTAKPTPNPSVVSTKPPTALPTIKPTSPTPLPTKAPTALPTIKPSSNSPTIQPSSTSPTAEPSSESPTAEVTETPTDEPTFDPSSSPTD